MSKWLGCLCALMMCGSATGQLAPVQRFADGRAETLALDAARVAIFTPGAHEDVAALFDAHTALEPLAISGWWLAALPVAAADAEALRSGLDELAASPLVDLAAPVFFDHFGGPLIPTQDVLVRFASATHEDDRHDVFAALGLVIADEGFGSMERAYRVTVPSHVGFDALAVANVLAARDDVEWADVDWIFSGTSSFVPSDPEFTDQWGLVNTGQFSGVSGLDIGAELAWDVTTGDASVITLVIDVGVQSDHPDLNLVAGADLTSDGPGDGGPVNVCDNHGTPVAGCVSAQRDNALGGTGVAPDTRVASARTFISTVVCDGSWMSQASWTVDALAFGESIGARISNNSNGYGFNSPAIDAKYADTRTNGMVHFGAIGNDGLGFSTYPSSLNAVNAIGAIQSDGTKAPFSNFGADVIVVGPGVTVLTTDRQAPNGFEPSDAFVFADGTSFASPYVAGVAALMLSIDPMLTPAAIETALKATSTDLGAPGRDPLFGDGLVSAVGALEMLVGPYGTWVDEGNALAGTLGDPALAGKGLLLGDTPVTLTLTDVAPGLLANLLVGFTQLNAPFKGGVLVPSPDLVFGGFPVTASPLVIGGSWPIGLPSGVSVSYQYWMVDAGGPVGFSASNALMSTTP